MALALQLMKLQVTGSTVTNVDPTSSKFFHVTDAETAAGTILTIDTADFFLDDGSVATTLPALATDNSYFTVSINGVLQMEGILTYTPGATTVGSLTIDVPAGGDSILAGTPIVLEVVSFTPSSTTTVET
jgi:Domain of unknown function (DUF4183)